MCEFAERRKNKLTGKKMARGECELRNPAAPVDQFRISTAGSEGQNELKRKLTFCLYLRQEKNTFFL